MLSVVSVGEDQGGCCLLCQLVKTRVDVVCSDR